MAMLGVGVVACIIQQITCGAVQALSSHGLRLWCCHLVSHLERGLSCAPWFSGVSALWISPPEQSDSYQPPASCSTLVLGQAA